MEDPRYLWLDRHGPVRFLMREAERPVREMYQLNNVEKYTRMSCESKEGER